MEAMVVHSSSPVRHSPLSSPVFKRSGKTSRGTNDGNNNNTKRRGKRPRSSVSPTVQGNGRIRRAHPPETDSDTSGAEASKPTRKAQTAGSNGKFKALNAVHRRLNALASDSNSDAQDSIATPKAKRSVQSTSSRLLSLSPDPIDGLDERSSPPPTGTFDPNTSPLQSDEDTPKPKAKRRERSPLKPLPISRTSSKSELGKSKYGIRHSLSAQPKPTARTPIESSSSTPSLLGDSPLARRKSTVSTSVVKRKGDQDAQLQSQDNRSASGSVNSTTKGQQRVGEAESRSPRKKHDSRLPALEKQLGAAKERRPAKPIAAADRFSDDESERPAGGSRSGSARKSKKSLRDEEGARFLEDATGSKPDSRTEEKAKIKAKLASEERLAAAQFEAEDRERAARWRGVEANNRQGESFFASTATVDIAKTEGRIARAQAAIE